MAAVGDFEDNVEGRHGRRDIKFPTPIKSILDNEKVSKECLLGDLIHRYQLYMSV